MTDIYIDEEKLVLIVGKPSFEYEVTHTEYYPESDTKKIWVKRITKVEELKKLLDSDN